MTKHLTDPRTISFDATCAESNDWTAEELLMEVFPWVKEDDFDGTVGRYDLALSLFKGSGKSANANRALEAALVANLNVAVFLLEMLDINDHVVAEYPDADFQRAFTYVRERRKAWDETPGAIAWLASYSVQWPEE